MIALFLLTCATSAESSWADTVSGILKTILAQFGMPTVESTAIALAKTGGEIIVTAQSEVGLIYV